VRGYRRSWARDGGNRTAFLIGGILPLLNLSAAQGGPLGLISPTKLIRTGAPAFSDRRRGHISVRPGLISYKSVRSPAALGRYRQARPRGRFAHPVKTKQDIVVGHCHKISKIVRPAAMAPNTKSRSRGKRRETIDLAARERRASCSTDVRPANDAKVRHVSRRGTAKDLRSSR
jgi:hypothetical protein